MYDGPREHLFAKVQIMGGPLMSWSMTLDPATVEQFLRSRMASVAFRPAETVMGDIIIDFSYVFHPGYIEAEGQGELRVAPSPGMMLDRITYGMCYDLLEAILQAHPENTQLIVAFEEFRALVYIPHLPRHEGIFRLTEDFDRPLSKALFPASWQD